MAATVPRGHLDGLVAEPRPGPPTISVDQVEAVVVATQGQLPKNATHWSRKSMAEHSRPSKSTVGRIWRKFQLKPHLTDTSQIQALDRPQPVMPITPGMPERRTHDYVRNGLARFA